MSAKVYGWHARLFALETLVSEQQQQIAALQEKLLRFQGSTLPIRKIGGFTEESLRQDRRDAFVPGRIEAIADAMDAEGLG